MEIRPHLIPDLAYYMRLPYATRVARDQCGDEPCFLALHPELPGCMAQGSTRQEALTNLRAARADYIQSLLDDQLPVPMPARLSGATRNTGAPRRSKTA